MRLFLTILNNHSSSIRINFEIVYNETRGIATEKGTKLRRPYMRANNLY